MAKLELRRYSNLEALPESPTFHQVLMSPAPGDANEVLRTNREAMFRLFPVVLLHAVLATFALAGVLLLQERWPVLYMYFILEDSASEYAGAVGFFIAAPLFFLAGRRSTARIRRLILCTVAVVSLVVGLEEISWGQRIIGVGTPEALRIINEQDEINIHNMVGVNSILQHKVAAYGLLALTALTLVRSAFRWRARGGAGPYSKLHGWIEDLPLPPATIVPWVLLVVVILLGPFLLKKDEVGEFFLGLVAAGWAMTLVVERPLRYRPMGQIPTLSAMALPIAGGLALSLLHQPNPSWRAHMTAFRDYPAYGMYKQALEVAGYILARPRLHRDETEAQYQDLLRKAREEGVTVEGAGQGIRDDQ